MHLEILAETENWIAVSKPAGLIVEKSDRFDSLEDWVFEYLKKEKKKPFVGIVHRLDRVTSGAILFAKKKSSLKKLNELIRFRKIYKSYVAIVEKAPAKPEGTLTNWLEKNNFQKRAIVLPNQSPKGKQAILKYKIGEETPLGFLMKIKLTTGRFHQIRAQFSAIGCPIVGDEKYGSNQEFHPNSICLHSSELSFLDPFSNKKIEINAPIPENWEK